jgi:polar amino acid transport system substrate-binding protein
MLSFQLREGAGMKQWWGLGLLLLSLTASAQTLRLGFGTDKPPYVFENQARGLEYDIVVTAAERAGFTLQVEYAPMERLHLRLRRGEIDAIATTNELSGVTAFYSDVYIQYQNAAVALRSRQLDIQSISDLGRYSVSAFQRARFLLGSEFQAMAHSNPRYREEAYQITRNRLLYSGRVDVVVSELRILHYFNREVHTQVDVSQPLEIFSIFPATHYKLGCRLESDCQGFNRGLANIRESGEYAAIERRYAMD